MSVIEEQLESLGDDELALVISWFSQFHNNRLNRRRSGGPKEGCYGCGDPDHFIAHCPKKKPFTDKYDSDKRKDKRDYTSGKHKAKGGLDKEAIKKAYRRKAKAQERAFLASLSDLDDDSDDDHSSSPSPMMSPTRSTRTSSTVFALSPVQTVSAGGGSSGDELSDGGSGEEELSGGGSSDKESVGDGSGKHDPAGGGSGGEELSGGGSGEESAGGGSGVEQSAGGRSGAEKSVGGGSGAEESAGGGSSKHEHAGGSGREDAGSTWLQCTSGCA
ncbi:spore wall protein 1-like [Miscanthus floridulus]|uniref:spore wall protein 1-like n=1 Tax=Miscanthus floridulus TaxID=154761 RepID=UPI0034573D05